MLTHHGWVKYSAAGACLEATYQHAECETNTCVEVAIVRGADPVDDRVMVRNSTDPERTVAFTPEEWQTFLNGVRTSDTFDLPRDVTERMDLTKVTG